MIWRGLARLPLCRRVAWIGAGVAVAIALLVAYDRVVRERDAPGPAAPTLAPPAVPIASEADVFRTRPGDLAVEPSAERSRASHPRTLETYRSLRAYPGAPPRIPHGLTADEYRESECGTCHERGGYVARFDAYVPVTPHPQFAGSCLQCHMPDARVMGVELPSSRPGDVCRQCHSPGDGPRTGPEVDWRSAAWPRTEQRALPESPPTIPHDLQMRTNCLACHGGPSAVAEIRTDHPERANCRQCHLLAATGEDEFRRPLDANPPDSSGGDR